MVLQLVIQIVYYEDQIHLLLMYMTEVIEELLIIQEDDMAVLVLLQKLPQLKQQRLVKRLYLKELLYQFQCKILIPIQQQL